MNALVRLLALIAVLALAACGGGMQAGVGSGGSGAPLAVGIGSVGGFGSVIVNGDRYDETQAEVQIDERPDRATPATAAAIRLGMHVELEHRNLVITRATTSAELVGPIGSLLASGFVALGQNVRVNADAAHQTVFEGFDTLADLVVGTIVEVHGDRGSNADILATRIELRPAGLALVRIAGTASNVNGRAFTIGALNVDAASANLVPAGTALANGQRVVAWTDTPYTGGTLSTKVVRIGTSSIAPNATVTLDGVIGDFDSAASFRVSGVRVSAGSATFTGGVAADLGNGIPVRVRGTFNGSVLNATSVEFLRGVQSTVQLTGAITDFVDPTAPFRIRNSLARVTAQTTYVGGAASNLGSGVQVKLTGLLSNGVVQATTVEFLPVTVGSQRVVFGQIAAPPSPLASDGSRTFRIDALSVDVKTTATTAYKNGTAADVALGRQVKLKGSLQTTQFVADEVQFQDNASSPPTFEIDGIAGNVRATSVVVNGQTVQLAGATTYTLDGAPSTIASLKDGLEVAIVASRSGSTVTAISVEITSASAVATKVRGIVSGRTPADAVQFLVGSQRVSVAGSPAVLPATKTLADVVNGADIEVRGTLASGVLNVTRIQIH